MTTVDKMSGTVQGTEIAQCPNCGSTGISSTDLFMASMLGSELPLDFEIYCCPRKHYWRVWDDGTVDPFVQELQL